MTENSHRVPSHAALVSCAHGVSIDERCDLCRETDPKAEPTAPPHVLQRDLDFYRRRYRERSAEIKTLRAERDSYRAKYADVRRKLAAVIEERDAFHAELASTEVADREPS